MSEHDLIIKEEDRPFLAQVLFAYRKRMLQLLEEVQHGTHDSGGSLVTAAKKASELAHLANPGVFNRGLSVGLKYPREKKDV